MSDPHAQKAFRVFEKALDMEPEARASYLAEACADNAVMQRQVLDMIARAEAPDAHLQNAIGKEIQAVFRQRPRPMQLGDRIGAYRLEALLGRGGMGEVFLAIREDDVAMKAAVKVSLSSPDDRALIKRFKQEREILASLKHPNIAQLYDAGTTAEGRPFFIMEFVPGIPIDAYCRQNQLSFEARLILFRQVCDALSYAHRNLVLHRDIKPANILVTREGTPKLLDFGISGLMNPSSISAKTQTVLGLTPGFASPEQLEHRRLTAASDIYSLGVLLYALLTDTLPIPVGNGSPMAFFRKVQEHQVTKPSEVIAKQSAAVAAAMGTTPRLLRRKLQGDVDLLVMTALAKSPEARFTSAEAFSLEIERYQHGLPIHAREPRLRYRLGKFIVRNRWQLTTACVFFTLLLGFSIAMFYQKQQTALERNRARQERDVSRQITNFLVQTFQGADPNRIGGEVLSAKELLDQGASRMDVQLQDHPEVRAKLLEIMGTAYRNLGDLDGAQTLLEEAVRLQRQQKYPNQEQTIASFNALGLLYKDRGEYERAEPLLRQALDHSRNQNDPNRTASSLNSLGLLLADMGQKSHAETYFREAYSLRNQVSETTLAGTVNNLGLLLKDLGQYPASEPFLQEALALHQRIHPAPHPTIATSLNNLGLLAKEKGDLKAAESHWRASLAMRRELYLADHPKLMTSLNNLAAVLKDKGDLDAAEPLFREVLNLKRRQFNVGHPRLIVSLNNLAVLLVDKGDPDQADPYLKEALAIASDKLSKDHLFRWVLTRNQALLRLEQGQFEEGFQLAQVAVNGLSQKQTPNSLHLVLAKGILGRALLENARYSEAQSLLEASYAYLNASERQFPLHSQRLRAWLTKLYGETNQAQKLNLLKTSAEN